MQIAKISSKQQVTLSKALLTHMGIGKGGRVWLEPRARGTITVRPMRKSIVEQTAGSLTDYVDKKLLGTPFKVAREKALEAWARHVAMEGR